MKRSKFVLEGRLPIFAELEEDERFVSRLNFIFPAVNRFDGRENIRARRKPFVHQLVRNPARDLRVRKCAQREQDFFSHRLGRDGRFPAANPATAYDNVCIVNDGSLPGCDGALRVAQSHVGAIVLQWSNCRDGTRMIIADFHCGFEAVA